jgi:hypothetical protein
MAPRPYPKEQPAPARRSSPRPHSFAEVSHGGNIADAMESSAPINAYTVPLTADAETAMARVRREATDLLRSHRGTYATALFGRYAENTAKLAMIAAVSRDPARPITQARDVTWAAALVEHCIGTLLREAERLVADTPAHSRIKKVLEVIRKNGRISRSAFVRKTQFLSKAEREDAIATLLDSNQIAIETTQSASGPGTSWIIATEPQEGLKSDAA